MRSYDCFWVPWVWRFGRIIHEAWAADRVLSCVAVECCVSRPAHMNFEYTAASNSHPSTVRFNCPQAA